MSNKPTEQVAGLNRRRVRDTVVTVLNDGFLDLSFFDLYRDPGALLRSGRGIVAGRRALIDLLKRQRDESVSHVAFNMKIARWPAGEVLDELAEHVLPLIGAS